MYIDLINASEQLLDQGHMITTPEIALCAGSLCSPSLFKQIKTKFNIKRLVVMYILMLQSIFDLIVYRTCFTFSD